MIGPVVEALGCVSFLAALALGRASLPYVLAFLSVALALGLALSFAAVGLEELSSRRYPRMRDLVTLLCVAIAENFGYGQISIYWRLRGMISKLRGAHAWGTMERKGFATSTPEVGGA